MNNKFSINKLVTRCLGSLLLLGVLFGMNSCKDEVDTSNMFTATEQSIFEYIDSVPEYSSMAYIFRQVKLGEKPMHLLYQVCWHRMVIIPASFRMIPLWQST